LAAVITLGVFIFRSGTFDSRHRPSAPSSPSVQRPPAPAPQTPSHQDLAPKAAKASLPIGDPSTVLAALTGEGLSVGERWKLTRGTDNWWAGTARKWPWGIDADLLPDEFSYGIESTTSAAVEKVELTAEVYNPAQHGPAMKAEFVRLVPILFDRLRLATPTGLPDAINGESPFTETTAYGVVRFERLDHKGRPGGHNLTLTIEATK
jgi:hypothetical protein